MRVAHLCIPYKSQKGTFYELNFFTTNVYRGLIMLWRYVYMYYKLLSSF